VSDRACWGIYRERTNSPGRESDDAEILRLTAKHLEALGAAVSLRGPEELASAADAPPRAAFLMCEGLDVLDRLSAWEAAGTTLVNSPGAVLNTYRDRMIRRFQTARVPFIESRLVSTTDPAPDAAFPLWVKRADVHNTQEGDVTRAETRAAMAGALAGLAARGMAQAVLQPHVDGDLIKFYGIGQDPDPAGGPIWFRWFYHRDQRLAHHPFAVERLARIVRDAAAALGLEVYGGDAIATAGGELVLLDLNAWPSFALYRDEAAPAIAQYLFRRFGGTR